MSNLTELGHGRLTISLPGDWRDRSTLLFIGPHTASASAPLQAGAAAAFQSNIVITVESKPEGIETPKAFLEQMSDSMHAAGVDVQRVDSTPFPLGEQDGWCIALRVDVEGTVMRQLVVATFCDELAVVATGSTEESMHAEQIELLREILATVRFE